MFGICANERNERFHGLANSVQLLEAYRGIALENISYMIIESSVSFEDRAHILEIYIDIWIILILMFRFG